MKQQILSFLSTVKDEILDVNQFLYTTSENCFNEYQSVNYITNLLKKYGFVIENNFLNISTAFRGKIGNGHPEICFICKYSTGSDTGHIFGNNSNATIALGSAIALTSIIDNLSATITVIGCPGKYSNGSEIIMTKEKVFENASIIFAPHVDNLTSLDNKSPACIPLEISFSHLAQNSSINMSALDLSLQTIHFINRLIESTSCDSYMDHLSLVCDNASNEYPTSAKCTFEIKSNSFICCNQIEHSIREYIKTIVNIMKTNCTLCISELPCKELLDNEVVNKIFESNLKQQGLIDVNSSKNTLYSLGIGSVSHSTPTIYPSISICEDKSVACPSEEFKQLTTSDYAKKNIWKAIEALSLTAVDLIERPDLIIESTNYLNTCLKIK